jgi:hypothetical protein
LYYVIKILVKGAKINEFFQEHRMLLKQNKMVIGNLIRLSDLYFGEAAIVPDNSLYKQCVFIMNHDQTNKREKLIKLE